MMDLIDQVQFNEFASNVNHQSKKIRFNALEELEKIIDADATKLPSHENYIKLLIKLFQDEAEVCREKSINIVLRYLSVRNSVQDEMFISIVLIIKRRLGEENVQEVSEEIRCLLLKISTLLVSKSDSGVHCNYIKEIVDILSNGLKDSCSEVKKDAFELVVTVAAKCPDLFHQYSQEIVKLLLTCTKHKHFRIRSGSLDSLKKILHYCHKDVISVVYGSLGECLLDQNVQVRISVLRAVSNWMQTFPDKYSYTYYALPIILSSLLDDSKECREEAFESWSRIGLTYLKDNEEQLKEKNDYLPKKETLLYEHDVLVPNDGCYALVQKEIGKFLPTIVAELDDWRREVRIRSAKLLKVTIIHADSSIIPFLDLLIPAMLKKCSLNEDVVVSHCIIEVAQFIGGVVSPNICWKMISPHLKNDCTINHLILLSSLLKFSEDTQVYDIVDEVTSFFVEYEIFNLHEASYQEYLLRIFSKLLNCCRGKQLDEDITRNIYMILLSSMALNDEVVETKAFDLVRILCSVSEFHQSTTLFNKYHFAKLFPQLVENCSLWRVHSTNYKIFIALICRFADDVFSFAAEAFTHILEVILHPEFDKELKFSVLLTLAKLIENDTIDVNKHIAVIREFLLGPVKRLLIWRSGKVVQVIRSTALTIFNLCLRHAIALPAVFIEDFIPVLISLCEDNYEESRIMALHALTYSSCHLRERKIKFGIFANMFTAAVGRLEDVNHRVRATAPPTIVEIFLIWQNVEIEKDISEFHDLYKSVDLLVLMSADENTAIRNAVRDILKHSTAIDFLKRLYSEEKLAILTSRCTDEDLAASLRSYWKI